MVAVREHGFSLVELMIASALIAVLAGVAVPSIGAAMKQYSVTTASQQLVGAIRQARGQAVSGNQVLKVHFAAEAGTYQILDSADAAVGPLMLLPDGTAFVDADVDVEFTTSGRIDPAVAPISIVVGDGDEANNRTITVTSSGRVALP